jgi:hypothetical protein
VGIGHVELSAEVQNALAKRLSIVSFYIFGNCHVKVLAVFCPAPPLIFIFYNIIPDHPVTKGK